MNGSGLAAMAMLAIGLAWNLTPTLHGSQQSSAGKVENYTASLVVVPGVSHPRFRKYADGRQQIVYIVHANYPAKDVLAYISAELSNQGWKPLRYDLLNPQMSSSIVRGWEQFEDSTQHPPIAVHQWMADWTDRSRNITTYELEYRYTYPDSNPSEMKLLRVVALYIPAAVASKMRQKQAAPQKHSKK